MEKPVLTDPAIYPSDEILQKFLNKTYPAFLALNKHTETVISGSEFTWKYYNDGKSWLMNVSLKKKTLYWISVYNGFFRTTFYISSRAEEVIAGSTLPDDLKKQYSDSSGNRIRGITHIIRSKNDIEIFKELLEIKFRSR